MTEHLPGFVPEKTPDEELDQVEAFFFAIPEFERKAGGAIRRALDDVINGPKTGRWDIAELEKVEKTYIGLRVEIELRAEFDLPRGIRLDCSIEGIEVDIKFSIRTNWMIPIEAYDPPGICLLATANDYESIFSIGLLRTSLDRLGRENRDHKRGISKAGRSWIRWLVLNGPLPENVLLHVDPAIRERIFSHKNGQQRIIELFRNVHGRIIPREVIESVAQQLDPMRRARNARTVLAAERIVVICGTYAFQREEARRLGLPELPKDDWISTPAPEGWIWVPPGPEKQGRWLPPEEAGNL